MSDAPTEARLGGKAVALGVFLLLVAGLAAFLTQASASDAMRGDGGPWQERAMALQLAMTTLWLGWAGIQLVRRAPLSRYRGPAVAALLAGIVGVATFAPLSFGHGWAQEALDLRYATKAFLLWGTGALVAGVGHLRGARPGAGWWHVAAAGAILAGVYWIATHH